MGLLGSDLPRFVLEIAGIYNSSVDDSLVQEAGQQFTNAILNQLPGEIARSKASGAPVEEYLPYFMNDAGPDQNVTLSYQDFALFEQLQYDMDPRGFWKRTGGYKY
jgi:hypothetical protein